MATQSTIAAAPHRHPPGLYVLFFTELWERYSFYSMMAILTLYMDEALHFNEHLSGQVYGSYIAGVYFLPLIGGWLADRVLGFNKAVIVGAALMMAGHFVLAVERLPFFFTALGLLACGSGLLKPNVSTIVGNLYHDRPELRDAGFNIFYMGINIGAFISPIAVAWFRARYGWGVAFASAGVAMAFSLAIFVGFNRYVAAGAKRVDQTTEVADLPPHEARARVTALLVIYLIVIAFWVAFYQNGFTLTFWARDNTATSIAPETFQAVEPLGIILFTPLLVAAWTWLRQRNREPSTLGKILLGMIFTALSFAVMVGAALLAGDHGRVSPWWLVSSYGIIAIGEICLSPMGLSLVTKVAPPRLRGMMMGAWFVTLSLGGYFSGALGAYWMTMPHATFFVIVTALVLGAAVLTLGAMRWLKPTFAAAGAD